MKRKAILEDIAEIVQMNQK